MWEFRAKEQSWRFRAIDRVAIQALGEGGNGALTVDLDLDLRVTALAPGWTTRLPIQTSGNNIPSDEMPEAPTGFSLERSRAYSVEAQTAVSGRVSCRGFEIDFQVKPDSSIDGAIANRPTKKIMAAIASTEIRVETHIQPKMKSRQNSIAIVDDDASLRISLVRNLRMAGFEVRAYPSAEEYLASDALRTTDLLLADLRLEGMGGIDLSLELKRLQVTTAVIFMTAHSQQETSRELEAVGNPICFRKPFDVKELRAAIRTTLDKAR